MIHPTLSSRWTMVNEVNLAGEALHVADSVLALDYLHARGAFVDRAPGLPAVVLLDLKLPQLDGFEVLQHVRTTPAPQLVPIGYRKNKRLLFRRQFFPFEFFGASAYQSLNLTGLTQEPS